MAPATTLNGKKCSVCRQFRPVPKTDGSPDDLADELKTSALEGDVERIQELIEKGACVNTPYALSSGLKAAYQNGTEEHLSQADSYAWDSMQYVTLLHAICERWDSNSIQIVQQLLEAKADLDARSSMGCTPLIRACLFGNLAMTQLLLEVKANATAVDDLGRNALRCAVVTASSEERWLRPDALLDKEYDEDEEQRRSAQLIDVLVAISNPAVDINCGGVGITDVGKAGIGKVVGTPLLDAVLHNNAPAVEALLSKGAPPDWLNVACCCAQEPVIGALLKGKADPLELDANGDSALDVALRRGVAEITNMLRDELAEREKEYRQNKRDTDDDNDPSKKDGPPLSPRASYKGNSQTRRNSKDLPRPPSLRQIDPEESGKSGVASERASGYAGGKIGLKTQGSAYRLKAGLSGGFGNFPNSESVRRSFFRIWLEYPCRKILRNQLFQGCMILALMVALFLPDLWILWNVSSDWLLDVIILCTFGLFVFEIIVQSIGLSRAYFGSFFFVMDLLGAASLILFLSFLNVAGESDGTVVGDQSSMVIMRAARVAKLGARAGRLTRLVKLLRFLPGKSNMHAEQADKMDAAKIISGQLNQSLSTKVAALIIIMVVGMPAFSVITYPEVDLSIQTWLVALELISKVRPFSMVDVEDHVSKFGAFYANMNYSPITLSLRHPGPDGEMMWSDWEWGKRPARKTNVVTLTFPGIMETEFNFEDPHKIRAGMDLSLVATVVFLIFAFSLFLSGSVNKLCLRPLEDLLAQVRGMTSTIFKSVSTMEKTISTKEEQYTYEEMLDSREAAGLLDEETILLERIVQKMATLSEITTRKAVLDAETMDTLGEGDRAVLLGFQSAAQAEPGGLSALQLPNQGENRPNAAQQMALENAGLKLEVIDSWNFSPLELTGAQLHAVSLYFLGTPSRALGTVDPELLDRFLELAAAGYNSTIPYHSWYHAVDVAHTVYRELDLYKTEMYMGSFERFAVLVSALCHDIGHPGLNNPFLVETSHELALRYNDRSPLENMHCAKLFEIVKNPRTAIFDGLAKSAYQEVRKYCIETILHTDMIHHFGMVKELQMLYEVNSEVWILQKEIHTLHGDKDKPAGEKTPFAKTKTAAGETVHVSPHKRESLMSAQFPTSDAIEILRQSEQKTLVLNLTLHVADVANPMKPFPICEAWAMRCLDEFFLQGDQEKELGVPVQMLNDRNKVNRPFSQIGFIEFLVAPLCFAVANLMPPFKPCAEQLVDNTRSWKQKWISDSTPTPSEDEQKAVADRIERLQAKLTGVTTIS